MKRIFQKFDELIKLIKWNNQARCYVKHGAQRESIVRRVIFGGDAYANEKKN